MALVGSFSEVPAERDAIHDRVDCGWKSFQIGDHVILQLDTYGRPGRKHEGKVSQSFQLDEAAAAELLLLIKATFRTGRDV